MLKYLGTDEFGTDVRIYILKFRGEVLRKLGSNVRSIVVFGSRARGCWKPWSDIDVLIVLKLAPEGLDRFKLIPYTPMIQPWIYTEDEFYTALKNFDIAVLDALEHGIVVYDDGFWIEAKKYFQEFKKEWELVELEEGWVSKKIERMGRVMS